MAKRNSRRLGSDSRCCDSVGAPFEWLDHADPGHAEATAIANWISTLAPFARDSVTGELAALFEEAMFGLLEDTGDERTPIKPIVADPEVFELRKTVLSKKFRFYHAEPIDLPDKLVGLHGHIKVDNESQVREIEYTVKRYCSLFS